MPRLAWCKAGTPHARALSAAAPSAQLECGRCATLPGPGSCTRRTTIPLQKSCMHYLLLISYHTTGKPQGFASGQPPRGGGRVHMTGRQGAPQRSAQPPACRFAPWGRRCHRRSSSLSRLHHPVAAAAAAAMRSPATRAPSEEAATAAPPPAHPRRYGPPPASSPSPPEAAEGVVLGEYPGEEFLHPRQVLGAALNILVVKTLRQQRRHPVWCQGRQPLPG